MGYEDYDMDESPDVEVEEYVDGIVSEDRGNMVNEDQLASGSGGQWGAGEAGVNTGWIGVDQSATRAEIEDDKIEDNEPGSDGGDFNDDNFPLRASGSHPNRRNWKRFVTSATPPLIECDICAESLDPGEIAPARITPVCQHPDANVCYTCLRESIKAPIDEGLLHLIFCPSCPGELSREAIRVYATREVSARYTYLLMLAEKDTTNCLAVHCGHRQKHDSSEGPLMICTSCGFKTCTIHRLPWHEGMFCDEFDTDESQVERLEQEEATAKLLAKEGTRLCPQCEQGVHRTEGCDHIMCRCGHEWCFICMVSWKNIVRIGPEAHSPTCANHPRRATPGVNDLARDTNHMVERLHGRPVSEALSATRSARDARISGQMRMQALEAVERRQREAADAKRKETDAGDVEGKNNPKSKKKRLNIRAPWQE